MTADAPDEEATCATCGESVAGSRTRRVETWVEDGGVAYRHFCGAACRERWAE